KLPMEMPMEALYFPSQAQSNAYNLTFVKSSIPADNSFPAVLKYDLLVAYYRPGDCNIACINALQDCLTGEYIVGIGFVTNVTCDIPNSPTFRCNLNTRSKFNTHCCSFSLTSFSSHELSFYVITNSVSLYFELYLSHDFALAMGIRAVMRKAVFYAHFVISDSPTSVLFYFPAPSALTKELPIRIFAQLCDCVDESEISLFSLPSLRVLHMDFVIQQADSLTRLSAFGAENGWFGVFQTDMEHEVVLKRMQFTHDSAITHIQLFHPCASSKVNNGSVDLSISGHQPDDMDLLVCSSYEPAVVYRHVLRLNSLGVNNQLILPQSADYDNVNCASVGDFDFDGRQELVLGTFGQRLLFYRWSSTESSATDKYLGSYSLVAKRTLIAPIHSISPSLDLTGEGVDSLAVLTTRGLHIYRHKMSDVISLLSARLSKESL
ncbi:uncharacterized protein DEA37_0010040, partial [Paragonimus westermani]